MDVPHPDMRAVLERLAAFRAGLPNRYDLDFPQARKQLLYERLPWLDDGPVMQSVMRRVSAQCLFGGERRFGARIYTSTEPAEARLLIYLHGGGWCVGSSETHDNIVRRLAHGLGCGAWSIDYALAPEAPFPQGLLDCVAAIRLAARRHPGTRLVVAGDSAGANLALSAALLLRDRGLPLIDALLLFYGVYTDARADPRPGSSMTAHGDGRHGLSLAAHVRYLDAYGVPEFDAVGGTVERVDVACAYPLRHGIALHGLPRTWIGVAELDLLRDQSHALRDALLHAGVDVRLDEQRGVTHGFLSYGQLLGQVAVAVAAAAGFVCQVDGRSGLVETP